MPCNKTERNALLGSIYVGQYFIYTIPYSICMIVMCRQPLISNSAYKLMFGMGIIDLYGLALGSLASGLLSVIGIPYCPQGQMYWEKFLAGMGVGAWTGCCAICTSLAFNRFLDAHYSNLWLKLFGGQKAWRWVAGSMLYGSCYTALFSTPYASGHYHAGLGLWIIDRNSLAIPAMTFNNFLTPISLIALYVSTIKKLWQRARPAQVRRNMDRMMRRVTLITTLICSVTTIVALAYIIVPLSTEAPAAFLATNILWQACHGLNCILYITINDSIRGKISELGLTEIFKKKAPKVSLSDGSQMTPSPLLPKDVPPNEVEVEDLENDVFGEKNENEEGHNDVFL